MKKIIFTLFATVLVTAQPAWAYDILVVQNSRIKPYEEAQQGFRNVIGRTPFSGIKSISSAIISEFILSEQGTESELDRQIRIQNPDLILAIGRNALYRIRRYRDQPIVYLMAPFVDIKTKNQPNITGVDMEVSPARQLAALTEAIPGIKRVGLVYDPEMTSDMATEAQKAAMKHGVALDARQTHPHGEIPKTILFDMAGKIDAFWMLPDVTVITRDTLATLCFYANEEKLPILTFADKYLRDGATVSVSFDVYGMGEQAGDMARRILDGTVVSEIPEATAEKIRVKRNEALMRVSGLY